VKVKAKAKRKLRRAGKVKLNLQVNATDGSKNAKTLSRPDQTRSVMCCVAG
jgi:hypothetical protein